MQNMTMHGEPGKGPRQLQFHQLEYCDIAMSDSLFFVDIAAA